MKSINKVLSSSLAILLCSSIVPTCGQAIDAPSSETFFEEIDDIGFESGNSISGDFGTEENESNDFASKHVEEANEASASTDAVSRDIYALGSSSYSLTEGWQQCGTCEWRIENECLTIRPLGDGDFGVLEDWSGVESSMRNDYTPWGNETFKKVIIGATVRVPTMKFFFLNHDKVNEVNLAGLDTSATVDMSHAFDGCDGLVDLDLSMFDTSSAVDMSYMFFGCTSLASANLSSFDTSSVVDMSYMFFGCASLTSIDLDMFETSSVEFMKGMFEGSGLTILDLTSFSTKNTIDMSEMFMSCFDLLGINFSVDFQTESVKDMSNMFYSCYRLSSLDISSFTSTSLAKADTMFQGCNSLETIVASPDFTIDFPSDSMFFCMSLKGGRGTEYERSKSSSEYARIDDPENGRPGYFTAKNPDSYYSKRKPIYFSSVIKDTKNEIPQVFYAPWNSNWFFTNSSKYNGDLSVVSAALSQAAYRNTPGNGYEYIKRSLESLGFDAGKIDSSIYRNRISNNDRDYRNSSYDLTAYSFATQDIVDSRGEDATLVAVVVRGTPGNIEWVSNGNVANSGSFNRSNHEGFEKASWDLKQNFEQYLNRMSIDRSKLKIYVVGHSRGAAVANLFAASANKVYGKENVYAYTYATPCTTTDKEARSERYANIHNVVNPEDFVPRVPLQRWGFYRYGQTYYLPSKSTESRKFSSSIADVRQRFRYISNIDYKPFSKGTSETDAFAKKAANLASSVKGMYETNHIAGGHLITFHECFDGLTSMLASETWWDKGMATADIVQYSIGAYAGIFSYFFKNQVLSEAVTHAHSSETYIAWIKVLTEQGVPLIKAGDKLPNGKLTLYCPVDVEVRDPAGTVVARIVDDVVDESVLESDGSLAAYVDPDTGAKTMWVPFESGYTVDVTASDEGTLDITWSSHDGDGNTLNQKSYTELSLEDGRQYAISINDEESSGGFADTFVLSNDAEGVVEPTYYSSDDDRDKLSATVSVEGEGSATGVSFATKGDHATVHAYPAEGWRFSGWYEEGKLESVDADYTFRIESNKYFVARFEKESAAENPGENQPDGGTDGGGKNITDSPTRFNDVVGNRQHSVSNVAKPGSLNELKAPRTTSDAKTFLSQTGDQLIPAILVCTLLAVISLAMLLTGNRRTSMLCDGKGRSRPTRRRL